MDMWYVLEPPLGVSISTVAAKARKRESFTEDEVSAPTIGWIIPSTEYSWRIYTTDGKITKD